MTEPSRRALLAALGAATVSGCVTGGPSDDTVTSLNTTTATPTAPPTPTTPDTLDTSWPVPGHDAGRSHGTDAAGPVDRPVTLWQTPTDAAPSTPTIAADIAYVGAGDAVQAVDARTGDPLWRQQVGAPTHRPRVLDGRLFVPTDDAVIALNPDGSERWRTDTPDRVALLATSGGVYWLADRDPPVVVALGLDGHQRWQTELDDPWDTPLFAGNGRLFVSSGTHDSRFWRLDPADGAVVGDAPRSGADFPAEQFYRDGRVFAAEAFFGNVRATPVNNGDGWSTGTAPGGEAAGGLLAGADGQVYYTANAEDDPNLFALSFDNGSVAWTVDLTGVVTARPVAARETVLVATDAGVQCINPANGMMWWSHDGIGERFVVVDDLVYAAHEGGVTAFRPP